MPTPVPDDGLPPLTRRAGPALPAEGAGMLRVRRLAAAYFVGQGFAVSLWWVMLVLRPEARAAFLPAAAPEAVLLAFWLPDLALLAAGSLVAGYLCARPGPAAVAALWLVAGAMTYASLYTLTLALLMDGGWLGPTLMLPANLLTVSLAAPLAPPRQPLFRQARPAGSAWNTTKTFGQMVLFWTMLLFVVPGWIAELEVRLGIPAVGPPARRYAAMLLFTLCSSLGVWCALVMSRLGEGTPLPLDSPRRLVVTGPYAFVRNPMAIAGLGQGAAVALFLGSPLVAGYVVLGGFLWQCVARPLEEDDLAAHFGEAYLRYRATVRCWWPRSSPYLQLPAAS